MSSPCCIAKRTGGGQYIGISILDAYFHCQEMNVQIYSASNGAINPNCSGVHHPQICPTGAFRSKEGYLIIMAFLDHPRAALCKTMGRPELTDDPRFKTNALRLEDRDQVVQAIEAWIAAGPSDAARWKHWARHGFQSRRCCPSTKPSIISTCARQTVRKIRDPTFGEFDAPGFPLRFSAFPDYLPLTAPTLGQHNREVLDSYPSATAPSAHDAQLLLWSGRAAAWASGHLRFAAPGAASLLMVRIL